MLDLKLVAATDPEVAAAMEQELGRQRDHILRRSWPQWAAT